MRLNSVRLRICEDVAVRVRYSIVCFRVYEGKRILSFILMLFCIV